MLFKEVHLADCNNYGTESFALLYIMHQYLFVAHLVI